MTDPIGNFFDNCDITTLYDGTMMRVHASDKCQGKTCCIHRPSDHHMKTWPLNWRPDRRIMERMCSHGVGHPDPDDIRVVNGTDLGVHGCDGCCSPK